MNSATTLIMSAILIGLVGCSDDEEPPAVAGEDVSAADADADATGGEPDVPPTGEISCSSDKDCTAASMVCDPLAGQCVQCLFDADCGEGFECVSQACQVVVTCASSLDCVDQPGLPICDPALERCVRCAGDEDCEENESCVDNECLAFTTCASSKDCVDQVCDKAAGRCVDCLTDADCSGERSCREQSCIVVVTCQSDKDCLNQGMVCDKTVEECVQCLTDADCPEAYFCSGSKCAVDECVAGTGTCVDNAIQQCGENGALAGQPFPCAENETCIAADGEAGCAGKVCEPGTRSCLGTNVRQCRPDGLGRDVVVNCAQMGQACAGGGCVEVPCLPGARFCDDAGSAIVACVEDGSEYTEEPCDDDQSCIEVEGIPTCTP